MTKRIALPLLLTLFLAGLGLWQSNVFASVLVIATALIWLLLPLLFTDTTENEGADTKADSEPELSTDVHALHDEAYAHLKEQLTLIRSESDQVNSLIQDASMNLTNSFQG